MLIFIYINYTHIENDYLDKILKHHAAIATFYRYNFRK